MTFLDGHFEGGKVDLPQGTLADTNIDKVAVHFFIVTGKMLEACTAARALHT